MTAYEVFKSECMSEIAAQGQDDEFRRASEQWMSRSYGHKYSYHFEWLGRPVIQYPQETVALQELCWLLKPDLIIETGIAHGGSLILSASLLMLCDFADAERDGLLLNPQTPRRKVVGIDIDIRPHNLSALQEHPLHNYIQMIEGSSVDPKIVDAVRRIAAGYKRILVLLDSNHTHDHVLAELKAYTPLVSDGSYCIVYDTVIEDMPPGSFPERPWDVGDNPMTAVREFLRENPQFMVDRSIQEKLQITVAPDGYLKRVSAQ